MHLKTYQNSEKDFNEGKMSLFSKQFKENKNKDKIIDRESK